jgi:hypothetical protein
MVQKKNTPAFLSSMAALLTSFVWFLVDVLITRGMTKLCWLNAIVSPSLTQIGEIGSAYFEFAIIVATGRQKPYAKPIGGHLVRYP